jgi:hypothetical protein
MGGGLKARLKIREVPLTYFVHQVKSRLSQSNLGETVANRFARCYINIGPKIPIWFFWRVLEWKMVCWNVLRPSGILFGVLVYFVVIWCMFPVLVYLVVIWCTYVSRFGILYQEKSGNPGRERKESSFP